MPIDEWLRLGRRCWLFLSPARPTIIPVSIGGRAISDFFSVLTCVGGRSPDVENRRCIASFEDSNSRLCLLFSGRLDGVKFAVRCHLNGIDMQVHTKCEHILSTPA